MFDSVKSSKTCCKVRGIHRFVFTRVLLSRFFLFIPHASLKNKTALITLIFKRTEKNLRWRVNNDVPSIQYLEVYIVERNKGNYIQQITFRQMTLWSILLQWMKINTACCLIRMMQFKLAKTYFLWWCCCCLWRQIILTRE